MMTSGRLKILSEKYRSMRYRVFTILFILLLPLLSHGQYLSDLQRFIVTEEKGCATFQVNITNTNLKPAEGICGPNPCDIQWGDNSSEQITVNNATHIYAQPGTYTIRLIYQSTSPGIPNEDFKQITVRANNAPVFEMYSCGGRQVQVKVTDTGYDGYIINYNDGSPEIAVPRGSLAVNTHSYAITGTQSVTVRGKDANAADNCTPGNTQQIDVVNALTNPFVDLLTVTNSSEINLDFNNTSFSNTTLYKVEYALNSSNAGSFLQNQILYNTSNVTLNGLSNDNNYYCFRIGSFDPCINNTTYSNIICSADIDLAIQNKANNVSWSSSPAGVNTFSINRDGSPIGSVGSGASSFLDNNVVCNTEYCYQLFTNYTNGSQSISLLRCGTAVSNDIPTAIEDVTSVVSEGSVDLTWQAIPLFPSANYIIHRKSGSAAFNEIGTSATTQFTDIQYSTDNSNCYRIDYIDACNNASADGIEVCPIRLSGKVNNDNTLTLTWSDYTGWKNGVDRYIVEKYDTQGNLLQTFDNGTSLTFTDNVSDPDNQVYVYVIRAEANAAGLGQSVSNEIELSKQPNIYYPKAFTPNEDNLNDAFVVFGQFVEKFELKIFNRWGELLFTTTDLAQGWDGRYKGTLQPEGTYAFVAKITDYKGRTYDKSGSFVLLRKK